MKNIKIGTKNKEKKKRDDIFSKFSIAYYMNPRLKSYSSVRISNKDWSAIALFN